MLHEFGENAKNICMQSLYFLIPTFVICLLLCPIFLQARVSFNALENSGVICIYIFKVKIIYFFFSINKNQIELKNEKQTKQKALDFDSPEIVFYNQLMKEIKDKTRLRYLMLNYNIGLSDAFLTSMVCGAINVLVLIFFTSIKNKKPTASLAIYDTCSFNKTVVEIAANLSVSLTLFDLAYSLLNSTIVSKVKAGQNA